MSSILLIFLISLGLSALLAFIETSITALRLFNLKELAQRTRGYTNLLKALEKDQHKVLTTIIIANHLADITAAVISTYLLETLFQNFPNSIGFSLAISIATIVSLTFGEILPKNLANFYGQEALPSLLWLVNLVYIIMTPLASAIAKSVDLILHRLGNSIPTESKNTAFSEKEITFMIDYTTEKGLIAAEKTTMLKSIFSLSSKTIEEIMVPAHAIILLDVDTPLDKALALFAEHHLSRLPVYETTSDNIIGLLHVKDLCFAMGRGATPAIKSLMRPILFVPESVKISQVLSEFKQKHMHLAVVLSEYGQIVGLVSLEDVLEEIVGDIHDEYETHTPKATALKTGVWLVDASIELKSLAQVLGIAFEEQETHTLGGFLSEQMQRIPQTSERLAYKNFLFQIQQANSKRVMQVLILDHQAVLLSELATYNQQQLPQ